MSKENVKKGILDSLQETENDNIINSNSDIDSKIDINNDSNADITIKKKKNNTDKHIQRLFYITPELDDFLEKTKKKTGRDKSEIVRLALNYLKNNLKIQE